MIVEISVAVNYILAQLYSKLPRRRVNCYGEELEKCLQKKLQPFGHAGETNKDAACRVLNTSGPKSDSCFAEAAQATGLDWTEIRTFLPADLVIEIDPGYVAVHSGSNHVASSSSSSPGSNESFAWGNNTTSSSSNSACSSSSGCSSVSDSQQMKKVLYTAAGGATAEQHFSSTTGSLGSLSTGMDSGCMLTPEDTPPSFLMMEEKNSHILMSLLAQQQQQQQQQQREQQQQQAAVQQQQQEKSANSPAEPSPGKNTLLTAAAFAQTKFGSTKLKNQAKRNKRIISPTEAVPANLMYQQQPQQQQQPQVNATSLANDDDLASQARSELSNSKLEMLREAIQQQQQMLDFSPAPSGPSANNSNGNAHHQHHHHHQNHHHWGATAGLPRENNAAWPTPIGSQRKNHHHNSHHNSSQHQYQNHQQSNVSMAPGFENYNSAWGAGALSHHNNSSHHQHQHQQAQFGPDMLDDHLSFELGKLLNFDNGAQQNAKCHGNDFGPFGKFDFGTMDSIWGNSTTSPWDGGFDLTNTSTSNSGNMGPIGSGSGGHHASTSLHALKSDFDCDLFGSSKLLTSEK